MVRGGRQEGRQEACSGRQEACRRQEGRMVESRQEVCKGSTEAIGRAVGDLQIVRQTREASRTQWDSSSAPTYDQQHRRN